MFTDAFLSLRFDLADNMINCKGGVENYDLRWQFIRREDN